MVLMEEYIDQWKRIENTETHPITLGNLIFLNTGTSNSGGEK